jgi:hypothetical protein
MKYLQEQIVALSTNRGLLNQAESRKLNAVSAGRIIDREPARGAIINASRGIERDFDLGHIDRYSLRRLHHCVYLNDSQGSRNFQHGGFGPCFHEGRTIVRTPM